MFPKVPLESNKKSTFFHEWHVRQKWIFSSFSTDISKVNAPVCDLVSVCGHFFMFSSIDEAGDEKPYDNHYKHVPEVLNVHVNENN